MASKAGKQVTLGVKARDVTSGFTGIVLSKTIAVTGIVQFTLQPSATSSDPSKLPEAIGFDENVLEYVDAGASAKAVAVPLDVGIKLGEEVIDLVNDFAGIATRRTEFMNGCVFFELESRKTTKDGHMLTHFVDSKRLKRAGIGVVRKFTEQKQKATALSTGGPTTRNAPRG